MNLDDIRDALRAAKLDRLVAEAERLTLPAIHIETRKTRENSLPIGASKIGGRPDLPSSMPWPAREGKSLGFLAQFNLAEVAPYDSQHILPTEGALSFFYDFAGAPWGLKPEDRGGWHVLYFAGNDATLSRSAWPDALASHYRLPPRRPVFSATMTLAQERQWLAYMRLNNDERRRLAEVFDSFAESGLDDMDEDDEDGDDGFTWLATQHQLLGLPAPIHGGSPLECELAPSGRWAEAREIQARMYAGDEAARARVRRAFERWQLLLQLGNVSDLPFPGGTEDDPDWRLGELCDLWARGGLMYFWIEKERLKQRDFSNVWLLASSQL